MQDKGEVSPAEQIGLWADELRHMSANGLRFAVNVYDRTNYARMQEMAMEMLALATGQPLEQIEAIRAPIFSRPSPINTVDAAIINEQGKILLIRRADNRKWAMPGGGLDVGETPAQGAAREALEETGVHCEPVSLVGVHDSRFCGVRAPHQLYMYMFLCRPLPEIPDEVPPSHAEEVIETGWFGENELPPDLDPGHVIRIPLAFQAWRNGGKQPAYFDR
jgi:ADP-ribose pyrophosphatase YjhB (NUDIX family)